jgi:hypothetical protein
MLLSGEDGRELWKWENSEKSIELHSLVGNA